MTAPLRYGDLDLRCFETLPRALWSEDLFRAGEHVRRLVDAAARDVLDRLGAGAPPLSDDRDAMERWAAAAGVAPARRRHMEWLVAWVGDEERAAAALDELDGALDGALDDAIDDAAAGLDALAARAAADVPAVAPSVDLVTLAARGYPDLLRGERDGLSILFSTAALPLWERYFSNDHILVGALNVLGAHAAQAALARRDGLDVLELGGGFGSAAETLIETFGARLRSYTFTDAHPGFLRRGAERLAARFPDVPLRIARADIDRPLDALPPGRDLIYAVNVLHLAEDVVGALERIRGHLADDGVLVLVEGIRAAPRRPAAAELVFTMLPHFDRARLDDALRPAHGFLSGESWIEALRRAGYRAARAVPELAPALAAYPNQAMAAFVARA